MLLLGCCFFKAIRVVGGASHCLRSHEEYSANCTRACIVFSLNPDAGVLSDRSTSQQIRHNRSWDSPLPAMPTPYLHMSAGGDALRFHEGRPQACFKQASYQASLVCASVAVSICRCWASLEFKDWNTSFHHCGSRWSPLGAHVHSRIGKHESSEGLGHLLLRIERLHLSRHFFV